MSERDNDALRREFETLNEILEEKIRTTKAESKAGISKNETAIERLRADMERHRATTDKKIEDNAESMRATSNANTMKIMIAMGIAIAVIGVLIRIL